MNGGTLSQIIAKQGKQSLYETIRVTTAMCRGRSRKKSNQLGIRPSRLQDRKISCSDRSASGRLPKAADFGIAKWSG